MMRAKLQVRAVLPHVSDGETMSESVHFSAVTGKDPFGPGGESEDNTYACYTPTAELTMTINNPALFGKLQQGQSYYVDFSPAGN